MKASSKHVDQPVTKNGLHLPRAGSRFFDSRYGHVSVKVMPGEYYVSCAKDEMIVTVLGSCVAACIRDPKSGIGGMNHFMLPEGNSDTWGGVSSALRYGNHAMETLINNIMSTGCPRHQLEVKVFGGANVNAHQKNRDVGARNAEFVIEYLENEGIPVAAQDLGGAAPRRIHYFPVTGKVKRLFLRRPSERIVFADERNYRPKADDKQATPDIELFD